MNWIPYLVAFGPLLFVILFTDRPDDEPPPEKKRKGSFKVRRTL